ncbi:unnamed protein product [Schistocephalus solidus]|uniref:Uncharacterized protein n=1 Tax=Schistocephalus solidus TaxID=70667 RepID=A0A183SG94_SCHSO|nr:unnamed protein product [Schistocephalus solidus]
MITPPAALVLQFSSAVIAAKHLSLGHLASAISAVPTGLLRAFRKPVDPSIYVFPRNLLRSEGDSATPGLTQEGNSRKRGIAANALKSPATLPKRARLEPCPASLRKMDQPTRSRGEHCRLMFLDLSGDCCLREGESLQRKVSQAKCHRVEGNALELLAFSLACSDARSQQHQFSSASLCEHFEPPSTERACTLSGRHITLNVSLRCVHRACASSRVCLHSCANILSLVNSLILPMGYEFDPDLIVVAIGSNNVGLPGVGFRNNYIFLLNTKPCQWAVFEIVASSG